MSNLAELLDALAPRHRAALKWFNEHAGTERSWPAPLGDGTFLVSKAKAIYKPQWMPYALSIRENLGSLYKDQPPIVDSNGNWHYRYFQENPNVDARDAEYTNRALIRCIEEKIPVGVLIQTTPKPNSRYKVFGLGLVKTWENGFFIIEGLTPLRAKSDN